VLDEIRERQCGAVSWTQALAAGLTISAIRSRVATGRWQRVFRSTYATFSGPVPRGCLLWAAVLCAGTDAVLSHESAAELVGLSDEPADQVHVTVPSERKVRRCSGIVIHRSGRVEVARHPVRLPPQTRVEETVVDLTQTCTSVGQALGLVAKACGNRLTRPERIAAVINTRKKLRWRQGLLAVVGDVAEGAHSVLELRYLRDVERAHGLPRGSRQYAVTRTGGRFYDDVRYLEFGVVVELDGRAAHPDEACWRDLHRDNASVADGSRVLRYGWADVTGQPCAVAAQVFTVLRSAGWRGAPRPCRPDCSMIAERSGRSSDIRFP
jgi:hypothetical protein